MLISKFIIYKLSDKINYINVVPMNCLLYIPLINRRKLIFLIISYAGTFFSKPTSRSSYKQSVCQCRSYE